MPFHKLSQWLTYSLLEPFEWAGVTVTGLDALTGLPEYRNGGLLIDIGILRPVEPDALARRYTAGDEFIVEWRALTVALLLAAPRVMAQVHWLALLAGFVVTIKAAWLALWLMSARRRSAKRQE